MARVQVFIAYNTILIVSLNILPMFSKLDIRINIMV